MIDPAKLPDFMVEAAILAVNDRPGYTDDDGVFHSGITVGLDRHTRKTLAAGIDALVENDEAIDRLRAEASAFGMAGDDDHERARYRAALPAAVHDPLRSAA